jgi:hypothetical protein
VHSLVLCNSWSRQYLPRAALIPTTTGLKGLFNHLTPLNPSVWHPLNPRSSPPSSSPQRLYRLLSPSIHSQLSSHGRNSPRLSSKPSIGISSASAQLLLISSRGTSRMSARAATSSDAPLYELGETWRRRREMRRLMLSAW